MPDMQQAQRQAILSGVAQSLGPMPVPLATQPDGNAIQQAFQSVPGDITPKMLRGEAPIPAPTDSRALDRVASAVEQQESGGNEKAVSPKGKAAGSGPMGISAALASDLKGNVDDPTQNREMGRTQLGKLHDKYGNWTDALAAYDWGEGNVDKWIAGGRKNKLPNETANYINSVQERAGLPGMLVVVQKREMPIEERQHLLQGLSGMKVEADAPGDQEPIEGEVPDTGVGLPETSTRDAVNAAFLTGARRGVMELVTGPTQAALEQIKPDLAQHMTSAINEYEGQFDKLTGEHPVAEAVGRVIGSTAAIMGTAGMLGATSVGATLARVVPSVLRYGAAGAAFGATEFRRAESDFPRWAEAGIGAALGAGGAAVGSALGWGSRYIAASNAYRDFTRLLQDSVGDLSKSTSRIKQAFLDNYTRVWQQKNDLYTLRNQAGREFEGFDPKGLGLSVKEALATNRKAGVSTTVGGVASKVVDELGLREIAARQAAHEKLVGQHAVDYQKWEQQNFAGLPEGPMREGVIRQQVASGKVPPPPVPPPPLEQQFVSADRYSAAQQAVARASRSKQLDPQSRRQLAQIRQGMEQVAVRTAQDHNMEAGEFLRRASEANRFFRENIAPVYDSFVGGRTPQQAAEELTNAQFFDRVSRSLKANDSEALGKLVQALGPTARAEVARVAEWEMLQAVGKTKPTNGITAIGKYIRDRQDTLRELLGRDRMEQLKGEANIAEQLMQHSLQTHRHLWQWGTRSILLMVGGERIVEGVLHGDTGRMAQGVGLIATPFAVHAVFRTLQKLTAIPYMLPMLRRAAKLRPGSPELDKAIRQIEMRLGLTGVAGQRALQGTLQDQAAAGP